MHKFSFISILFLGLTASISSMAETYECSNDSIKAVYEVTVDDAKFDGIDVVTYETKAFQPAGELKSKDSGVGSISEAYENGQVTKKEFHLGTSASLWFITKDSEVKLRKAGLAGSGANFYNCTVKN